MTDDDLRRIWAKHAPNIGGTLEYAREVYAIAYRAGMERAAEICESLELDYYGMRDECAAAIRAHAQNQPKTTHDGSVV